jgi:ankyrin repeat protein
MPMDAKLSAVVDKYRNHPQFLGIEIEDPNQPGAVDDTMLHIAAGRGALEDMEVLIEAGANVDALGDLGNTPLHDAALLGQTQAALLLLRRGARTDIRNEFGETAADVARQGRHAATLELLESSHNKRP